VWLAPLPKLIISGIIGIFGIIGVSCIIAFLIKKGTFIKRPLNILYFFIFYLLPFIFYLLSFTFYLLPFIFYFLSFTFYLLLFIFYLLPKLEPEQQIS